MYQINKMGCKFFNPSTYVYLSFDELDIPISQKYHKIGMFQN